MTQKDIDDINEIMAQGKTDQMMKYAIEHNLNGIVINPNGFISLDRFIATWCPGSTIDIKATKIE